MITLLVYLAIIGLVAWLLITLIPMPEPFPKVIIAAACLIALIILLNAFALDLPVPRLR